MLTVPDSIKDLLHLDSCKKNIRIHFPNGEREDICNDLIVKDSVSFTESLCSQNKFKFGLCENSVFECEVVGVSNVTGALIEVACEIFCDSTVSGAEWKLDLEDYVYAIPYGMFIVKDCQRQSDMIHRKIVAYGLNNINDFSAERSATIIHSSLYSIGFIKASNQEIVRNNLPRQYGGNITYDPIKRLYARLNLIDDYTTKTSETLEIAYNIYNNLTTSDFNFIVHCYGVTLDQRMVDLYCGEIAPALCSVDDIYQWALEKTDEEKALHPSEAAKYEKIKKVIYQFLYDGYNVPKVVEIDNTVDYRAPFTLNGFVLWKALISSYYDTNNMNSFACPITDDHMVIYPYNTTSSSSDDQNAKIFFMVPYDIDFTIGTSTTYNYVIRQADYTLRYDYFDFWKISCPFFELISKTQPRIKKSNPIGYIKNCYYPDLSVDTEYFQKVWEAYCELRGIFARIKRNGQIGNVNIKQQFGLNPSASLYPSSSLHPEGVTGGKLLPQDYQTCWYDDYYTKPYGAIECEYKNTNNTDVSFVYYLTGYDEEVSSELYETYSLKDNYIIQNATFAEATIQTFCETIAANIDGVTFMPVEFVGRGLPYVEAGDTFEILTASNDSITTIVLNRTLSGEQVLTDSYKSV